jgi:SpoVK/Ycf46/Vps4 family AAA+-type ATPase
MEWENLFLMPSTRARIEETKAYLDHYEKISNDPILKKQVKPGCRILFYGDSGTGKTLTAALLGKYLGRDVYRVDISTVSSKYIGETSKRLNSLFNTAEQKGWIIFIDEGDAILGQRKSTADNNGNSSQYANQDVAFLLQRIENYDGIVIVATNLKNNIDLAFMRRFESMVKFDMLNEQMQMEFWQNNLPEALKLSENCDLSLLIKRYPLSPASIVNAIIRSTVLTYKENTNTISQTTLELCIKDEEFKFKGRSPFQ